MSIVPALALMSLWPGLIDVAAAELAKAEQRVTLKLHQPDLARYQPSQPLRIFD